MRRRQPGYQGHLIVDAGSGRVLSLSLWDTEEQANAVSLVLAPVIQQLIEPYLTAPTRTLGSGTVTRIDLAKH